MDASIEITGVVLAGGKNKRFGGIDKAFSTVDCLPMVAMIIEKLGEVFEKVIVVAGTPSKYKSFSNVNVIDDIIQDQGPLGGIHAAMINAATPYVFVVSCDMPFIDTGIIRMQASLLNGDGSGADAYIPRIDSVIQPLHGLYCCSLAGKLEQFLSESADHSVMAFLKKIDVRYIDLTGDPAITKAFININTPPDSKMPAG